MSLRSVPKSPLVDQLKLTSYWGPQPSERTLQVLRVYDLERDLDGDTRQLLERLQATIDQEPTAEKVYAFCELAFLGAKKVEKDDPRVALDLYGASVLHAYDYLFDPRFAPLRNPYDPQYRGACDLYNGALEGALRIVCASKELVPGRAKTISTAAGRWDITCVVRGGGWQPQDFEHFEFVSDYEIRGLKNHYRTHGLGVPLIAVRRSYAGEPAAAKYYPAALSFPVTAFLRPLPAAPAGQSPQGFHRQGVLELYDPLTTTDTIVAGNRRVPLESDLSTPLAYFLADPSLESLATAGLLDPDTLLKQLRPGGSEPIMGLYMAQPYEPGKIPVLLVHGLWSSPMTWMEMFNDLRSSQAIRDHYQFWFYLYPTGQPFWISATQLRRDLAEARQALDPYHREPALDQMVLVGHSMGGLVSKLQTIDSQDRFWHLASDMPFRLVKADAEIRQKMQSVFFFHPNPSIRRVITIGTPHRGSSFSNQTTQWLTAKLISLPQMLTDSRQQLFRDNKGMFRDKSLLKVETSIESLSPDCRIFPVMLSSRRPPWVKYHNIVGLVPDDQWLTSWLAGSDGVVAENSARVDGVDSELIVAADHTTVQSHPRAVLEVRRILLEHLAELQGRPVNSVAFRSGKDVPSYAR